VWGIDPPAARGRSAREILSGAKGLGVLFLAGADPVSDSGDAETAARALDEAGFVVSLDLFLTESSRRADVVLPAAAVYERDGTLSNWEGRTQPVRKAVPPAGLAQSDYEILGQIAAEAGVDFPQTLEALRKEMKALSATPGAARPVTVGTLEQPSDTATALVSYSPLLDDGTMMAEADLLKETAAPLVIEVNPADAGGLLTGETAVVRTARGEVHAPIFLTDAVARGAVFVRAHDGFAGRTGDTVQVERA
jgi:NADH-quinone oxidoreductase subunit G